MKSLESQLRRYREAAILRAECEEDCEFKSKNARKRWNRNRNRAKHVMRSIAKEFLARGPKSIPSFLELLRPDQPAAIRRWAAFHVLELSADEPDVTSLALRTIDQCATVTPNDSTSDEIWLRNWRASNSGRHVMVKAICRLPIDYRMAKHLSPVELLQATRYPARHAEITLTEVEKCFRESPELADAWMAYSEDQHGDGWFVIRDAVGQFTLGRHETGESQQFTDGVVAIAKYATLKLQSIGELAD